MSVQNEIDLQNLVAQYRKILSMKIMFNTCCTDIKYEAEYIKTMPEYEEQMSADEKADIENIITVTSGITPL